MYEAPPPAPQRGLTCPACGEQAAPSWSRWQPACQSCGAELTIAMPAYFIIAIIVIFLALGLAVACVIELLLSAISSRCLIVPVLLLFAGFWIWVQLRLVRRWGRVALKKKER